MLSLKDKVKLIDELIQENSESTIATFVSEVQQIEKEIELIESKNNS